MFDGTVPNKSVVFEPARRKIADLLRSRPDGYWTVDEVAARQRINRTVAFDHLEALVGVGLATKARLRGGRGRPANAYRYVTTTVELSYPPQQNRLLAQVLARAMDAGREAREVARDVGSARGDLRGFGDDYEMATDSVHARTCIFEAVCMTAPDVVCDVHAGLIEGALESAGQAYRVTPDGPDGFGGCRFHLKPPG